MTGMWTILVVGVSVLDAAILAERLAFGGTQGQLLHGAGLVLVPFYAVLAAAWIWLIAELSTVHRLHLPIDWKRTLVLAGLASIPLVL